MEGTVLIYIHILTVPIGAKSSSILPPLSHSNLLYAINSLLHTVHLLHCNPTIDLKGQHRAIEVESNTHFRHICLDKNASSESNMTHLMHICLHNI